MEYRRSSYQHFLRTPGITRDSRQWFIPVSDLNSQVLLAIKGSTKYGGTMLWSRYHDDQSGYIFHILLPRSLSSSFF
ncbi:hypothetical protein GQ457_07G014480 [Hibiscus cannabinus]